MVGEKRKRALRWPSVVASRRLLRPTSPARTARLRYSRNGEHFETLRSSTRKESPGIASSIREFILLQKFAQDDRVKIHRPRENLQVKMTRGLPGDNEFVSYIDAIGELDGTTVSDRLENYREPLPGRARGVAVARSADDLLFLDQRNSGCRARRVRSKKCS